MSLKMQLSRNHNYFLINYANKKKKNIILIICCLKLLFSSLFFRTELKKYIFSAII